MPHELQKAYDPTAIEDRWAAYWVNEHLFHTDSSPIPASHAFTMLLPPPNVTGRLHMGHMLNQTEMDILTRWHRMCGDLALWIPGTDHAGIATQLMVERQLAGEGSSRQQLGREAFIERVWQWKQHYGGAILDQMKRLGASVDWSREYFTMDDRLSAAVREAFVRLYEQGLIYRGKYIVNWDPVQQTAVSDLEVTHEERKGKLYHVRYPLADGSGSIVIATTRPETMLGDVAVAVNPADDRYTAFHGKKLRLPLSAVNDGPNHGKDREIPIVTDDWANPEFGTGAVKVTPAHDPNDFAIGERHNLPQLSIMDAAARIDLPGSPYHGLDRYVARKRILEDLEAQGLLVDTKEHTMAIGLSQRSGAVVEPRLSTQWFIKIQPLADKAIEAVEEGHIKFTPAQYAKTYFEWMRNIHDWCISRQLWWGHRIPAWHCAACHKVTVARETPSTCAHCGDSGITQETDVLDTWFSSGLLPFTVFDWPQRTPALNAFYPTSLLVTGFDILFFWVARMIMLGCHFMLDMPMPDGSPRTLKDAVPFREVYIHALVRDADRQKMSKTKGNVIDPIEIVQKYGTDAVRFTLAAMASPGTDIAFSEARTEGYRAFANKIWNAARFIFMNMERAKEAGIGIHRSSFASEPELTNRSPIEALWIVSRLNRCAHDVNLALEKYRFDEAANFVYQFFWGEFCDWYLEIVKLRLDFGETSNQDAASAALTTLLYVFKSSLQLLAPFMPFISEEIWQALYDGTPPKKSIARSDYPRYVARELSENVQYISAEEAMQNLQRAITGIRTHRKELGVEEKTLVAVKIACGGNPGGVIRTNLEVIQKLSKVSEVEIVSFDDQKPGGRYADLAWKTFGPVDIFIVYEKPIDLPAERERLAKKLEQYEKMLISADRQLQNPAFLAKAPEKIVAGLKKQASEAATLRQETLEAIEKLEQLA
ncbi:MAG TPA: valine--tRNA ligase [Acidobacteriaceae bacterium]|nr:valine--tRNA ligase [Acidobacteriaceae bacterium]